MKTEPTKKQKAKLSQLVKSARECGMEITIGLEDRQMPMRFPSDTKEIILLIEESERMSALGNKWLSAKVPNQMAAQLCLQNGWAFSLAAAWLRAKLKGECLPENKDK